MTYNILEYLENSVKLYSDKIAFEDLNESFTFGKLLATAKKIGSCITEYIVPRSPVVVYMEKSSKNIAAFLGAVYAGCFYVPIDSNMPIERIELIFSTLEPNLIICDENTEKKACPFSDKYRIIKFQDMLDCEIKDEKLVSIRANSLNTDLLYVLFTSGSTGIPKGVSLSHLAVIDCIEWMCDKYSFNENTIFVNQVPYYFDASVPDIYIPLKTGATTYIPPQSYFTFPKKILQFIDEKKATAIVWVPSALINVVNCNAFDVVCPRSIKYVIFCGEVLPCKYLNIWRKHIPDALYVNMYGPTEATYACTYYDINRNYKDDEKLPIGKACENSRILLITDNNELAEEGEIGEICILGNCLSNGYYNDREKTARAFVQNPINSKWNELMYKTGDLAFWSSGELYYVGRKDFQIKRLGHRIELGEIESAVNSITEVHNSCCIFNENSNDIVILYSGDIEKNDIKDIIKSKLPKYMMPTQYYKMDSLPLNLNGKIDRSKLKHDYLEDLI